MDLIGFLFLIIFGLATFYFYYLSKTSKSHKVKDASVIILGFMSVLWLGIFLTLALTLFEFLFR